MDESHATLFGKRFDYVLFHEYLEKIKIFCFLQKRLLQADHTSTVW